jgi:SAM-dependent methyltransferase
MTHPAGDPRYFQALYEARDDPWGLGDRFYERRKRALLMASLPRERFRRAFEPGCALGHLTRDLAGRCDEVIATDVIDKAVALARVNLSDLVNVEVTRARLPDDRPDGLFDLVVLCEVGYYCADLDALVRSLNTSLSDDGVLVACHWQRRADDHPHTAETVHGALGQSRYLVAHHLEDDFLLDVWAANPQSVAQAEGIDTA